MTMTDEMKRVIKESPYLSLITVKPDGAPHGIIVGGKQQEGDNIAIGIYKMEVTQKNLAANNKAWVLASCFEGQTPKGYRFAGTASVQDKKVVFVPESAQAMI